MIMTDIHDLDFAAAIFQCEITGQFCQDGICSDCLVAAYFCNWDEDKTRNILNDILR